MKNIIGRKVGMTSVFTADGRYVPVTVIEAGPCTVLQRKTVASDGYEAVFSLGEIDPNFGNQQDLVAYADTAWQLGGGPDGFARIVVPGDYLGGRYVSNITSIEVLSGAVPEPASLTLVALPVLGLLAARSRRRNGRV